MAKVEKKQGDQVRVRVAPSPTGQLHLGTARAALFNELFARQHNGQFILRIEDTDQKRSTREFEDNIIEGLRWLGLMWDEGPDIGGPYGPYRQSERRAKYKDILQKLVSSGRAYQQEGGTAIWLAVEPQEIVFTDLVRGKVSTHTDSWGGDFVVARSLDDPVYHLAVVADDAEQHISHVIRGEDHLSNTARQILIQRALGIPSPGYAHLPLLLDERRRKLSKRAGDVSALSYRDQGYLPQALLNYLALLGWNPKNDRELFTHQELIDEFSLAGVQKGGAIFSVAKLQAVNKHYLRSLSAADLLTAARPFLEDNGYTINDQAYWQEAVKTEQERVATLSDLVKGLKFFKPGWQSKYSAELLRWRETSIEATLKVLVLTDSFLGSLPEASFTGDKLEQRVLAWIDQGDLGRGDVLWPMRVALTGQEHSPGPFEVASILGKTVTLERLLAARRKLEDQENKQ